MAKGKTIAVIAGAFFGCAALMLGLCGGLLFRGFRNADKAVSPRIDAMFTAIKTRSFADTYETHTTRELREVSSKEEYAAMGNAIELRLGELKSKALQGFKMGQRNTSSYIDVTYAANFEKGSGTIVAQLKKEKDGWKFMTFRVNSPVFNQDLATMKCAACGKPHTSEARFCPSCGGATGGTAEVKDTSDSADKSATETSQTTESAARPDAHQQ